MAEGREREAPGLRRAGEAVARLKKRAVKPGDAKRGGPKGCVGPGRTEIEDPEPPEGEQGGRRFLRASRGEPCDTLALRTSLAKTTGV